MRFWSDSTTETITVHSSQTAEITRAQILEFQNPGKEKSSSISHTLSGFDFEDSSQSIKNKNQHPGDGH